MKSCTESEAWSEEKIKALGKFVCGCYQFHKLSKTWLKVNQERWGQQLELRAVSGRALALLVETLRLIPSTEKLNLGMKSRIMGNVELSSTRMRGVCCVWWILQGLEPQILALGSRAGR